MITNKGSSIITKYLLGQAPEYAAYLALGVGATPLGFEEHDNSNPSSTKMDFEAFRIPVTSRGLVNDVVSLDIIAWECDGTYATATTSTYHGARVDEQIDVDFSYGFSPTRDGSFTIVATTSNTITYEFSSSSATWIPGSDSATLSYNRERMIFKGQLPVDQYYKVTEIALYPAASNNLAQEYDSKTIAGFISGEEWKIVVDSSENTISSVSKSIAESTGDITTLSFTDQNNLSASALFVNSENDVFTFYNRKQRYEGPRFYNSGLIIKGGVTSFSDDNLTTSSSTNYITTRNISLNLDKNSSEDYIKLAISVVSDTYSASSPPNRTRVRLEFIDSATNGKAVIKQVLSSGDLSSSRYYIISKQLRDFVIDDNFSWSRISEIRIYCQTVDALGNSTDDYIVLDGIRLDNVNTLNPLYGMIAYSRLQNQYENAMPIEKFENSQGYIEYRIGLNIV